MSYAWDQPAAREKKIMLSINDASRIVDIMEIGVLVPFKFYVPSYLLKFDWLLTCDLGSQKDPCYFVGCKSRWTPTDITHHTICC
jgi:hypothetical protein